MVQEFINYCKDNRNLSDNTIQAYKTDLAHFVGWAQNNNKRWSTLQQVDIENYLAGLSKTGHKPATINRHLSAIRSLLTWAHNRSILPQNVARWIRACKIENRMPMPADKEALLKYLATEPTTENARTIHALIAIILDTGCRLQEVIDIELKDIDIKQHSIRIHGKGKKERTVYFTARMMQHCCPVAGLRIGYLLPKTNQYELRNMMYEELRPYGSTHPHAIRHLYATEMLQHGADINAIGKLLGHESVQTTENYARLSNHDSRAQYNMYHL